MTLGLSIIITVITFALALGLSMACNGIVVFMYYYNK